MAMRRQQLGIGVVVVAVLGGAAVGWRRCGAPAERAAPTAAGGGRDGTTSAVTPDRAGARPDPRAATPASIAGVVTGIAAAGAAAAPLAGAVVCAKRTDGELTREELHEPPCTIAGADGAYRLAPLPPGLWTIGASAPAHLAAVWRSPPPDRDDELGLAVGEARTGVDLTLQAGGVPVRGVVLDVGGGPVADAAVEVGGSYSSLSYGTAPYRTRTAADGTFAAWAMPGEIEVNATADGYAPGTTTGAAPTTRLEVLLAPASELAGIVVDRVTQAPVEGAVVFANLVTDDALEASMMGSARTDAGGRYRLTRLPPGRYLPEAWLEGRFGRAAASVRLGVGEVVGEQRLEVHALATARGRVLIDDGVAPPWPCPPDACRVVLENAAAAFDDYEDTVADGAIRFDALVPGSYAVRVRAETYVPEASYPPVVIGDADVDGLTWTMRPGAEVLGRVRTADGAPVAGAWVRASPRGGRERGGGGSASAEADGSFRVRGLAPGAYDLKVSLRGDFQTTLATGTATATLAAPTPVELVVTPGFGVVEGVVVDRQGRGVADLEVWLVTGDSGWPRWSERTDDDGRFRMPWVEVGSYALVTRQTNRTDAPRPQVRVSAGQTTQARVTVAAADGVITGTVTTTDGAPIVDAYVVAAAESAGGDSSVVLTRWMGDRRPVMTDVDGAFRLTSLAPGMYTVRAFRRGGGEAIATHVEVGGAVQLVVRPTGSIAGTVDAGGRVLENLTVRARVDATGFVRGETFFRTGGAFQLRELPAGTFVVRAAADGAEAEATVTLAEGQALDGVRLTLAGKVRLRGRLVDAATRAPVAGVEVYVQRPDLGLMAQREDLMAQMRGTGLGADEARQRTSAADGTFVTAPVRLGEVELMLMPEAPADATYDSSTKRVTAAGAGPIVDIGDVDLTAK